MGYQKRRICWDLSVRLGYFVTKFSLKYKFELKKLGFERKARLFCDFSCEFLLLVKKKVGI